MNHSTLSPLSFTQAKSSTAKEQEIMENKMVKGIKVMVKVINVLSIDFLIKI